MAKWLSGMMLMGVALAGPLLAQEEVPTPQSHLGFQPGENRQLANWDELSSYYDALAASSPRVQIDTLGMTTKGRPFVMLIITGEENQSRLEELREVNLKLADPRTISGPEELARLQAEGRTVVLITQQVHSNETATGQMAPLLAHWVATSEEPRAQEIRENVILLHIPSLNPDGTQWTSDFYMEWMGTPYEGNPSLPFLYHYYAGHDNNRDWFSFNLQETQLTLTGAYHPWRPHIVHDVHQMGGTGARIMVPPFVDPYDPNVDPRVTAGTNRLGAAIASELIAEGKRGVVVNAQYDAYSPARKPPHYRGAVRILSETARNRVAVPETLTLEDLTPRIGFDPQKRSWNFPDVWPGGVWDFPQQVDYMASAAKALLTDAARNRDYWVSNFQQINQNAVDRWAEWWPLAWVIPAEQEYQPGLETVLRILTTGDVEVRRAQDGFTAAGRRFSAGDYVIRLDQPMASFANTLLQRQEYPDLREYPGGPPQRPYDVTAHNLPLMLNIEAFPVEEPVQISLSDPIPLFEQSYTLPEGLTGAGAPRVGVYKGWRESMPSGWTRWMFDMHGLQYDTLNNADIQAGDLRGSFDVLLFESQPAAEIVDGYPPGTIAPDFVGGLGDAGVEAIREFVRDGGHLIAIEQSTDFAIQTFGLQIRSAIDDIPTADFYIPGSILSVEMVGTHAITEGLGPNHPVWYWGAGDRQFSRAFRVEDPRAQVLARYASGDPVLAGWVLGGRLIAELPALVEARVGQGSITLFGFAPNYRGQMVGTWPFLFNALQASGEPRVDGR